MIYINKQQEPEFLIEFKKKYPKKDYDSDEFFQYRSVLNESLRREQRGLCAYCCSRIEQGKSHNEHLEPRHPGTYISKRTLDYTNIVASCNNQNTCGKRRENAYNPDKFIVPTNPECENIFDYHLDGIIEGDEYTIDLLNLNDSLLVQARKSVVKILQQYQGDKELIKDCFMDETQEDLYPYYNVIKWYYNLL